jgi:hypothetical protein
MTVFALLVSAAAWPSLPYPSLPRGEREKEKTFFSLLSLWERRAGEVRAQQAR